MDQGSVFTTKSPFTRFALGRSAAGAGGDSAAAGLELGTLPESGVSATETILMQLCSVASELELAEELLFPRLALGRAEPTAWSESWCRSARPRSSALVHTRFNVGLLANAGATQRAIPSWAWRLHYVADWTMAHSGDASVCMGA